APQSHSGQAEEGSECSQTRSQSGQPGPEGGQKNKSGLNFSAYRGQLSVMTRPIAPALLLVCALSACSPKQSIETRSPGVTAVADKVQVTVEMSKAEAGMTPIDRTITVLALDGQGRPVGTARTTLPHSLRYACVPLTPAMKGARKLVVTAEPGEPPEVDPPPD